METASVFDASDTSSIASGASDPEDDHQDNLRFPPPPPASPQDTLEPGTSPVNDRTSPSPVPPSFNASEFLPNGSGRLCEAPSIETALSALKDLRKKLCPHCQKGPGHVNVYFDPFTHYQMLGMQAMLSDYTSSLSATYGHWAASSLQAAVFLGRGVYCARVLCRLVRAFIADRTLLPINPYGSFKESMLANQDLLQDINLHLQELEKDITALKVVEYLARPEVKDKYGITKTISLRTAQQYLNALGYRWKEAAKGQYVDGHERADVVFQRDHVYVPKMKSFKGRIQVYG